jgi:hydroxypyruvate isomerase
MAYNIETMKPWALRYASHLGIRSLESPLFLHAVGSNDPLAQIRHAAELGLAGVQDNYAKLRSVELQERIGKELARLDLDMGSLVSGVAAEPLLWGSRDDAVRAAVRAEIQASIETARRLGGRCIVVVGRQDPYAPPAFQLANMAANLRDVAPEAQRAGMVLCVEAVAESRFAGLLVRHIGEAYALVCAADSPAVKLVFDTGHIQEMDGDLINNFRRVKDAVQVLQIADCPNRLEPGSGEINFSNFLRAVHEEGYHNLVELEFNLSQPGAAGELLALQRLRQIDAAI